MAESFHQDLRWENCHCLPKHPGLVSCYWVCSAIHILLFKVGQGQSSQSVTYSFVDSLSFSSCSDKDADPEANIWLPCGHPPSTDVSWAPMVQRQGAARATTGSPAAVTSIDPFLPTCDGTERSGGTCMGALPEWVWGLPHRARCRLQGSSWVSPSSYHRTFSSWAHRVLLITNEILKETISYTRRRRIYSKSYPCQDLVFNCSPFSGVFTFSRRVSGKSKDYRNHSVTTGV